MNEEERQETYDRVIRRIEDLIAGESDPIAIMATVVCELHHSFDHFDWTGFYRAMGPSVLKIGPYQGTHGCLEVYYERGVCGASARLRKTQRVPDVREFPGHLACSASTRSEIVVPVITPAGKLVAVLDVDSNQLGAFDEIDQVNLEKVCLIVGQAIGD
ncbi:MAG: GAF domain-containing protein [Planctomycetota bacterium]